ncbi:hypothetical protein [Lacimicrobium sp. SS2-24]|uniref:hypothetical protein n=1 Tax=Lacimicrobium sp. SS2-24 TaxID=2005569 RepID=UPI000B4AA54F|nr:hypothetical protein [Lacimicrobium sp. SS2-24]
MKMRQILLGLGSAWKDLLLLIVGIYLALWLEGKVQDWQEEKRQKDYLYRLSIDLSNDVKQLEGVQRRLDKKVKALKEGLTTISADSFSVSKIEDEELVLKTAGQVNNYHFFTPLDFTFVSMRESGDFKLIADEKVQNMLLSTYDNYKLLQLLQDNYIQGLDDHFIPLWLESVDMLRSKVVNKDVIESPLFSNMILFALNETSNRQSFINQLLPEIKSTAEALKALSGKAHSVETENESGSR